MESVATQLMRLLELGGQAPADPATHPIRRIVLSRDGTGDIIYDRVNNGECLAITLIDCDNVDLSANPTMAVTSNPNLTAYPARPLEAVFENETLYVFGPGIATFTFANIIAIPGNTAHIRVSGFILPQGKRNSVLNRLKLAQVQEIVTP